jgi:SAM-dependent methyltransferase
MLRAIQPEILDTLPPDDPAARKSRRELRFINHVMGNFRWFARTLAAVVRPGERVIEIGAGAGDLSDHLSRLGLAVDGLDVCPAPAGWPKGKRWHQCDLRDFDGFDSYDVVLANLVLHHFSDDELAAVGERLRRHARAIVASEPERRLKWRLLCTVWSPLLGPVTRHDARVSIEAGFRGAEMARALGLEKGSWEIACPAGATAMNRLVAVRRA